MGKISCQEVELAIPLDEEGIQVNFCKNPSCQNFGVKPNIYYGKKNKGRSPSHLIDPLYKRVGTNGTSLHCKACNTSTTLKSNIAVSEEVQRLSPSKPQDLASISLSCPTPSCENHNLPVSSSSKLYQKFGTTNSGSARYRCKSCKKTFTDSKRTRKHRRPEINKQFLLHLVNKSPVNRTCEILDISPDTYYRKLDWLYEQAKGFACERESKFLSGLKQERLYLCTDRQVHISNWTHRKDKQNCEFHAVGTACNTSSYVFGWDFNFDPNLQPTSVEGDARAIGDPEKSKPLRRYARLWLKQDYEEAIETPSEEPKIAQNSFLSDAVRCQYQSENHRDDIESVEYINDEVKLPDNGMLVHNEYTMYGHFFNLNKLLSNVEKVRFFLDQDSGIKNAMFSAFHDRIVNRTADAFYVKTQKSYNNDEKDKALRDAKYRFYLFSNIKYDSADFVTRKEILRQMMAESFLSPKVFKGVQEQWFESPQVTKAEPEKMIAYLTDFKDYDTEHLANLHLMASLHAIDRFFMVSRRRVNFFERSIASGSNMRRIWHAYSPYKPENYIKCAEIFRLFYNYCLLGRDKKTPAMRLGVAKGAVDLEKIIYY